MNSFFCCIIDPLSVDVWWSYWWNSVISSITFKSLPQENQWRGSLSRILAFYVLRRHPYLMIDKRFNLFDECAARCVHLFPQEEECTSSSWGDSTMYTPDSIANPQRMLTGINESGVKTKKGFEWKVILWNIKGI